MEQYISKSVVVAELERLKSIQLSMFSKGETKESCHEALTCISVYNEILSFLDTLEVKEVDLEKEIDECMKQYHMIAVGRRDFSNIAKHFFELRLKAKVE